MNESCTEDIHDPIVNFRMEENQIIGIRKSGKNDIIPFDSDTKEDWINYVKKQCLSYYKERISHFKISAICSGIMLASDIFFLGTMPTSLPRIFPLLLASCGAYFVFSIAYNMDRMKDSKKKMKEIEEKILLLNSEETKNQEERLKELTRSEANARTQELSIDPPTEETVSKTDPMNTTLENNGYALQSGRDSSSQNEKPLSLTRKKIF